MLQFMVTFLERLTPDMMASIEGQLQQNGGSVVTFLPDNSILALLTPAALEAAESLPGGAGHRPGTYHACHVNPDRTQTPRSVFNLICFTVAYGYQMQRLNTRQLRLLVDCTGCGCRRAMGRRVASGSAAGT